MSNTTKEKKKHKKEKKRKKDDDNHERKTKKKKKKNKNTEDSCNTNRKDDETEEPPKKSTTNSITITPKIVASDAIPPHSPSTSLLLFYQYIDPPLPPSQFPTLLNHCSTTGTAHKLTGRMRVANEGLNCTLTGSSSNLRSWIHDLVTTFPSHFSPTEFKITDKLPPGQAFPTLHVFKVDEIVNYGLGGDRAPSTKHAGIHLEPSDYHDKLLSKDTVVIDVRNHYESSIGRFEPPPQGAKLIDPLMRKSTEFPLWLDRKETKDALRGKQVLMYCTGGVRCERASALLREKMETEDDVKELGIKGVYQLQGGIDKYFRDFPEGGLWKGKNYVFDKRFAHGPPGKIATSSTGSGGLEDNDKEKEGKIEGKDKLTRLQSSTNDDHEDNVILGHCEACHKPWDKFRGKRRCPTCGVPSLICRDCFDKDKNGVQKLDKNVRCELCVKQNITSKRDYRERERQEMMRYEAKLKQKQKQQQQQCKQDGVIRNTTISTDENHHCNDNNNNNNKLTTTNITSTTSTKITPNPSKITRLFIKNLHRTRVTESTLLSHMPNITHIQWLRDKRTKKFYGSIFVEMATPDDAARAVSEWNGVEMFGRRLTVIFQKADGKDLWPVPGTRVGSGGG